MHILQLKNQTKKDKKTEAVTQNIRKLYAIVHGAIIRIDKTGDEEDYSWQWQPSHGWTQFIGGTDWIPKIFA